jgi:hypothetical protein
MAWSGSSYGAGGFAAYSSQLRIPRFGSGAFTSYFTVAAWVRMTTVGVQNTIVATTDGGTSYTGILMRVNSSNHPEIYAYENETDTSQSYTHGGTVSASYWYLIVWKLSPYGPYGKAQACISMTKSGDALSAFTCGNLTYNVRSNSADLTVGGRGGEYLYGQIDGLGVWSRAWSPNDLSLYYNSGSGRSFPFY